MQTRSNRTAGGTVLVLVASALAAPGLRAAPSEPLTLSAYATIEAGSYAGQAVLNAPACAAGSSFVAQQLQVAPTLETARSVENMPEWIVSLQMRPRYRSADRTGEAVEYNLFGHGLQSLSDVLPPGQQPLTDIQPAIGQRGIPVIVSALRTPVPRTLTFAVHLSGSCAPS
ncbi:hypothetical protein [Gloeobacter kilaueensis]|uniref:Uncharacterized protein n=1 Tax=Gloeobacter kilaueensis (strain ATCC BAA-2537 / CCAP 1431/1 / ULC 316 / JS1) TaxID=1183438 RepID=U5QD07_GLOK1|nr:hypothetical protein [Gloeobacter kilaueensis]AGY56766.1 hypothetical protein GKIL_0520 [Gloeobacter kilaueensis JS1]